MSLNCSKKNSCSTFVTGFLIIVRNSGDMAQIIWENVSLHRLWFLTTGKSECLSGMMYVQLRWWSCLEVAFYLQVLWFCYYVCALVTPSQQNPPFWDMGIGNSPLPYMCKSVGSPGKGRHRDLCLCKWCYRAWGCDQGSCVPSMTSLLKAPILARSGVMQYIPQTLLGNLKILYIIPLLFPWSH